MIKRKYTPLDLQALIKDYVFINHEPYQILSIDKGKTVVLRSPKEIMKISIKRFNELVELGYIKAPEPPQRESNNYIMLEVQKMMKRTEQRVKRIETLLKKQDEHLEKLSKALKSNNKRSIEAQKKHLEKIHKELMELEYYPFKP